MYKRIITNQGSISVNTDNTLIKLTETKITKHEGFFYDITENLLKMEIISEGNTLILEYDEYTEESGMNEEDRKSNYNKINEFLANDSLELKI